MDLRKTHKTINEMFHVHNNDTPPLVGWKRPPTVRKDLYELFAQLGYAYGAEIGVARGKNAKVMLETIPNLRLELVDPWAAYKSNTDDKMEAVYQEARGRLNEYSVSWNRKKSDDGAKLFADRIFDFVYIDGLHDFNNVVKDVINWEAKVRPGGIVSGHDYFFTGRQGVVHAVDAYTQAHGIYHRLYITKKRRESQSWFFVKEK